MAISDRDTTMEFSKSGELSVSIKISDDQGVTYTFRRDHPDTVTIARVRHWGSDEWPRVSESFSDANDIALFFDAEEFLEDHMKNDLIHLAIEKLKTPTVDGGHDQDPVPDEVKQFVMPKRNGNPKGRLQ
jgi:hypothetical protein